MPLVAHRLLLALSLVGSAACSGDGGTDTRDAGTVGEDAGGTRDAGSRDSGTPEPLRCEDLTSRRGECEAEGVSGAWRIVGACADDHRFLRETRQSCSGVLVAEVVEVAAQGGLLLGADTYSRTSTHTLSFHVEQPVSCVSLFGGCDGYELSIEQFGGSAECTEADGVCVCDIVTEPRVRAEASSLAEVDSDTVSYRSRGLDETADFCRVGGRMLWRAMDNDAATFLLEVR